jgi:hypothetical protein
MKPLAIALSMAGRVCRGMGGDSEDYLANIQGKTIQNYLPIKQINPNKNGGRKRKKGNRF